MKYYLVLSIILLSHGVTHAATEHYFERDAFVFDNGSGVHANTVDLVSPSVQSLTRTMTVGGLDLDDILGVGSFCGAIQAFAYTLNPIPHGWLLCDGTIYTLANHPELALLFFKIGNLYGGNSPTTFAVPDLRGRFISGKSTSTAFGTFYVDHLQGHAHSVSETAHPHTVTNVAHPHGTGVSNSPGHHFGANNFTNASGGSLGYNSTDINLSLTSTTPALTVASSSGGVTLTNPATYSTFGSPKYASETRPKNNAVAYYIRY